MDLTTTQFQTFWLFVKTRTVFWPARWNRLVQLAYEKCLKFLEQLITVKYWPPSLPLFSHQLPQQLPKHQRPLAVLLVSMTTWGTRWHIFIILVIKIWTQQGSKEQNGIMKWRVNTCKMFQNAKADSLSIFADLLLMDYRIDWLKQVLLQKHFQYYSLFHLDRQPHLTFSSDTVYTVYTTLENRW